MWPDLTAFSKPCPCYDLPFLLLPHPPSALAEGLVVVSPFFYQYFVFCFLMQTPSVSWKGFNQGAPPVSFPTTLYYLNTLLNITPSPVFSPLTLLFFPSPQPLIVVISSPPPRLGRHELKHTISYSSPTASWTAHHDRLPQLPFKPPFFFVETLILLSAPSVLVCPLFTPLITRILPGHTP